MPERVLQLPGHQAGLSVKCQKARPPDYDSNIVPADQAGVEEWNSVVRVPQCRQTPPTPEESHRPKESESMLGGERQQFVGVLQQRYGFDVDERACWPGGGQCHG